MFGIIYQHYIVKASITASTRSSGNKNTNNGVTQVTGKTPTIVTFYLSHMAVQGVVL
jgi:hypothetical protein